MSRSHLTQARIKAVVSAIRIQREILEQLRSEAAKMPQRECCGLLAGSSEIISEIFPAQNAHVHPATAYEIAPQELFRMMREMRARNLQILGIYHSHPRGENRPSSRDIERAYYPETPYFILSPLPYAPQPVRAFSIREGQITELKIEII